jgi:uncharacterized membrane protein
MVLAHSNSHIMPEAYYVTSYCVACHQVQYSALIAACDAAGNSAMVLHTVEAALSEEHTLDSITLVQLMKAVRALGVANTWQTVRAIYIYILLVYIIYIYIYNVYIYDIHDDVL